MNEKGKVCKPGEIGEIVVTDLNNLVFPFIRYRIGDLGVLTNRQCACGRGLPLIDKVEGRVWDVIVGTNGNRMIGALWHIVKNVQGIKQYQVLQENLGELTIKIVTDGQFEEGERSKLINLVREKCGNDMSVKIEVVDEIPLTESGKRRYIISRVSPFGG